MPLGTEVGLGPCHIVIGPRPHCVRWDPILLQAMAQQPPPNFAVYGRRHASQSLHPYKPWPLSIVAIWLDGS